jgi:hypothetical protein
MWARIAEILLACWLAISPFILHDTSEGAISWAHPIICAFLIALFALLSFWNPLKKIHLLSLGIAFWLWGLGYSTFPLIASPSLENSVAVGFLLFMLAIVPSQAFLPTFSWQEFYREKQRDKE